MDGRGGCCIERYAYDMSKVDRIMLKFRPIAPKPAVGGSFFASSIPEKKDVFGRTGRAKKRYVRDNSRRCNRKRRVFPEEKKDGLEDTVATLLPLLPEAPEPKDLRPLKVSSDLDLNVITSSSSTTTTTMEIKTPPNNVPIWLNFNNPTGNSGMSASTDCTLVMPQPVKPVGSLVIVECVTEACVDGEGLGLGRTDEEKRKNLERGTCPGFISDGFCRVGWTNEAYRRMVRNGEGESGPEMVWLVTKERLPVTCPVFACRVRLQLSCKKEKNSLTVPCDVWRMDDGGFAWKLDVKAALSLGR
ncbi:PREDICTED: uncharacterized protein LOC104591649 [Nelumbo nucifera]|uniref:DUF7950 domain-containing protein n=2 Tax=Nelumbo nucifera TaxID=4432 RepID=A0A822YGN3_NELNU|nr:PREDICTED: uncharacterized protein LOC104591649 [Nelumbo nucifera]DAD30641.1 TPA_asm: hypothetical protein HUJ06_009492 [Nelumbo nucifera]